MTATGLCGIAVELGRRTGAIGVFSFKYDPDTMRLILSEGITGYSERKSRTGQLLE